MRSTISPSVNTTLPRKAHLVCAIELVIHEARNDRCLSDTLIPQEHELVLCKRRRRVHPHPGVRSFSSHPLLESPDLQPTERLLHVVWPPSINTARLVVHVPGPREPLPAATTLPFAIDGRSVIPCRVVKIWEDAAKFTRNHLHTSSSSILMSPMPGDLRVASALGIALYRADNIRRIPPWSAMAWSAAFLTLVSLPMAVPFGVYPAAVTVRASTVAHGGYFAGLGSKPNWRTGGSWCNAQPRMLLYCSTAGGSLDSYFASVHAAGRQGLVGLRAQSQGSGSGEYSEEEEESMKKMKKERVLPFDKGASEFVPTDMQPANEWQQLKVAAPSYFHTSSCFSCTQTLCIRQLVKSFALHA